VASEIERPHGIDDPQALHAPAGERLVGFDTAHPIDRQKHSEPQDHRYPLRSIGPTRQARSSNAGAPVMAALKASVDIRTSN